MGVSKNRGTPKWMVYNGTPLLKWMIWGENPLFFGNIHIGGKKKGDKTTKLSFCFLTKGRRSRACRDFTFSITKCLKKEKSKGGKGVCWMETFTLNNKSAIWEEFYFTNKVGRFPTGNIISAFCAVQEDATSLIIVPLLYGSLISVDPRIDPHRSGFQVEFRRPRCSSKSLG